MKLSQKAIDELRSFIVQSNLEYALLEQLDDCKNQKELARWLGLE